RPGTGYDIIRVKLSASKAGNSAQLPSIEPLLGARTAEMGPELSPDGHFLAYQSDESGRFEVYVRPYPNLSDGRWQVSTNGGRMSAWTRDGRELLYLDGGGHLTSVAVETRGTTFRAGTPVTVLQATYSTPD